MTAVTEPIRRFPIAVFPILLGLMGAGLTLRAAAAALGWPAAIGELWLGMSTTLLVICAALYGAKLALRPAALAEDLAPPPARGGAAALSMSLMLAGAAMAPALPGAAAALWVLGALLHWVFAGVLIAVILRAPPEARPITPALYLPFVGQIVAPIGGVALGYPALSEMLYVSALALWAALTPPMLLWLRRATRGRGLRGLPAPMRPGLAILVAPPALACVSGAALGPFWESAVGAPSAILALVAAAALAARARRLAEGGWSPAWGAFTFPLAALAGAALRLAAGAPPPAADALAALAGALVAVAAATTLRVALGAARAARSGALFA